MLLVMAMVENGLCYWEQMQQISSEKLLGDQAKYVDLEGIGDSTSAGRIATIT